MKNYFESEKGPSVVKAKPHVTSKRGDRPVGGILAGMILCLSVLTFFSSARAWDLPECVGNQKDGWATVDNNWSWDHGNPYTVDGGGQWTLAGQDKVDPATTDEYKPLQQAVLWTFIRGWNGGGSGLADALFLYFGEGKDTRKLCAATKNDGGFPQNGPAAAILFKVPKDGKYQVAIEGQIVVQNKSAGWAKVQIFVLTGSPSVESPLKSFELNSAGGAGASLTDQLAYSDTVTMKAGDQLVTRLQTISPGQATAGNSAFVISKYSIVPNDKK